MLRIISPNDWHLRWCFELEQTARLLFFFEMTTHKDYKFSVTIHSDDLALVHCFRGLTMHCQATHNARIPWGGTKRSDWVRDGHQVTFHFSSKYYREALLKEAERLFPQDLWKKMRESDNDPAKPQTEE